MTFNKHRLSVVVLCLLYTVILFGTVFFNQDLIRLIPVILLISCFILFANHTKINTPLVVFACVVFISGWLIHWLGIKTGRVFGFYFYGNMLGVKLLDVPIIIGIMWLLLSYCAAVVAGMLLAKTHKLNTLYPKIFIGALLVVLIAFFMEQVAPAYDFWYWKNQHVPVQNYTAWFLFAFAFNYLFHHLKIVQNNNIAPWLYGLVLLCFVGLTLFQ